MKITRKEIIKKYFDYFKSKQHKHIPSASLIPENDPTALFTSAGMQPLVPYLLGQKHPLGKRLVDVQKCIRTVDIEEVGDTYHHTFLEMFGNWSLGDYWKKEAITYTLEFLTKSLGIPLEKLAITCFIGDKNASKDNEAASVWESLGIPKERIAFLKEDNWWGPVGEIGPCGPSTEIFYWKPSSPAPKKFNPRDDNWVEIGNDVLMEYDKTSSGFQKAKQKNIDFGGGVERTLAILNGLEDGYQSELFQPIIKEIERISRKPYKGNERPMRIIADHIKAAVFILGDNHKIRPSNVAQGYVLRRLIRRSIRYGRLLGIKDLFLVHIAKPVLKIYPDYDELHKNSKIIYEELEKEEENFNQVIEKGLKKFEEFAKGKIISGKEAFLLFQSYGFPIEMTEELANERGMKIDLEEYNEEFKRHQALSRTAAAGMFKSGLADESETTIKLHTATHLLNEALRRVVNSKIRQKGSNINPERLRFDFNFDRKLTDKEIKDIEDWVNAQIKKGLEVHREELPLEQALKAGVQAEFGAKYPEMVSVYTIGPKKSPVSKEICTGPHVANTKDLGTFKIIKEQSSAAGVRRIKAIVEGVIQR